MLEETRVATKAGKLTPGGRVMGLIGAAEAHVWAEKMIRMCRPQSVVYLLAFTFDSANITEALGKAKGLGATVRVVVDQSSTTSGKTRDQVSKITQMLANGVEVRKSKGIAIEGVYAANGKTVSLQSQGIFGIQHSKAVLVDSFCLMGSANWTVSSLCNVETDCLIHYETDKERDAAEAHFVKIWDSSSDFTVQELSWASGSNSYNGYSSSRNTRR